MPPLMSREELLKVQAAVNIKEEALRGEIEALESALNRNRVSTAKRQPAAEEPEDALDVLTDHLEKMVAKIHSAETMLDRRDAKQESLSQASTQDEMAPSIATSTVSLSLQPPPNVARGMSSGMRSILREIADRESAALAGDDDDGDDDVAAATPGLRMHHSAAMQSGRACRLRRVLTAYFAKHAPDSAHKVENLVARVVGGPPCALDGIGVVGGVLWDEAELFGKLEAKYGARVDA